MSPENIPFSDGDFGWEGFSPGEVADFDQWEMELREPEPFSRAAGELGKLSLAEIDEPMPNEVEEEPEPQIEKYLKPKKQEKNKTEKPKNEKKYETMDGSFLLDQEMADAAMGLIYLTTGVPVEEMNK